MAWTYNAAQIATTPLFQLRWLIGDTLVKDQQLQDEELAWAMTQRSSIYGAAADCCRSLAARMSREADSTQGPAHTNYSVRARNYRVQAGGYDVMAMARSAGLPYSGQLSRIDYDTMASDPDRIAGQFRIGMGDDPEGISNPAAGGPAPAPAAAPPGLDFSDPSNSMFPTVI